MWRMWSFALPEMMPCHPSIRLTEGKRGHWTCLSEDCCNMSRNSIFGSHIVFCCWYWELETPGRDKAGPSLPELWPWVPVGYKSVRAEQHSSEQVNRASLIPLEALSLLQLNNSFYKCWHLQTWTVWLFWKTELAVKSPPRGFRWHNLFHPGSFCFSAAAKNSPQKEVTLWIRIFISFAQTVILLKLFISSLFINGLQQKILKICKHSWFKTIRLCWLQNPLTKHFLNIQTKSENKFHKHSLFCSSPFIFQQFFEEKWYKNVSFHTTACYSIGKHFWKIQQSKHHQWYIRWFINCFSQKAASFSRLVSRTVRYQEESFCKIRPTTNVKKLGWPLVQRKLLKRLCFRVTRLLNDPGCRHTDGNLHPLG